MNLVKEHTKEKEQECKPLIIRYGWANENKLTWFFTKNKKTVPYKGSRLLVEIMCESSVEDLFTKDTYPNIGDVISDINGTHLKIKQINWI